MEKRIFPIFMGILLSMPLVMANDYDLQSKDAQNEYTHTVLAEYASLSYCPHCPPVSEYMNELYTSGEYNFYYVTLVVDKSSKAYYRFKELKGMGCPTVWFDGGYRKIVGNAGCADAYGEAIEECGKREVNDIDLNVTLHWSGDAKLGIRVCIRNNEDQDYYGHLRAYIVEKVSRWKDKSGKNYHFAFLDYAFDQDVVIKANSIWSKSRAWDGKAHGFGDISQDNVVVIAAIFDKGDSYVDQTAISVLIKNSPPSKPAKPDGPKSCKVGEVCTFSTHSTDPDGDRIRYCFDWGDGTRTWTDYYPSGQVVKVNHSWDIRGTYSVRVKAQDEYGAESEWSDPLPISVPVSTLIINVTALEAWNMMNCTCDGVEIPIDVRSFVEYLSERISTPHLFDRPRNFPLSLMKNKLLLELFKIRFFGKKLIIYCYSGKRSYMACKILVENGFNGAIYNMVGGLSAWKKAGLPTKGLLK